MRFIILTLLIQFISLSLFAEGFQPTASDYISVYYGTQLSGADSNPDGSANKKPLYFIRIEGETANLLSGQDMWYYSESGKPFYKDKTGKAELDKDKYYLLEDGLPEKDSDGNKLDQTKFYSGLKKYGFGLYFNIGFNFSQTENAYTFTSSGSTVKNIERSDSWGFNVGMTSKWRGSDRFFLIWRLFDSKFQNPFSGDGDRKVQIDIYSKIGFFMRFDRKIKNLGMFARYGVGYKNLYDRIYETGFRPIRIEAGFALSADSLNKKAPIFITGIYDKGKTAEPETFKIEIAQRYFF